MMSGRFLPDDFDPAVVTAIDGRLAEVERDQRVRIPLAIESGSRAWGFPSPDSDYDCRFVYVRRADDYLSLWPPRDVIETPLDAVLDVNGWDVGKLIGLLVKGNAVAIEWLQSPIQYRCDPAFRQRLLDLAEAVVDRRAVRNHYVHLGSTQWARATSSGEAPLKKLFYSLRPAAALRWLEMHPNRAVAPMRVQDVLDGIDLSVALREEIDALIAAKAQTREMGAGKIPSLIAEFVDAAFAATIDDPGPTPVETSNRRETADTLFRALIADYRPA